MEAGLQLHLPSYRDVALQRLLALSDMAHNAGVAQLWVTDNLQSRNAFVVLAALASRLPVRLGTAVLVQYFRSPVDVADAAAALSELMDGRELDLGISRGNPSTPGLVRSPRPITLLRETAEALQELLSGGTVRFAEFPSVGAYFNIEPSHAYRLNFLHERVGPVKLYCGGNAPRSLEVAGACMDGIVFGWTFLGAARSGQLGRLLAIADDRARQANRSAPLPRVAEIKLYIGHDDAAARAECRLATASRLPGLFERGYAFDAFVPFGVKPAEVERLVGAFHAGASREELADLITDAMVDTFFVAGDPARCRARLEEVSAFAHQHGFHQIMFSEIGHDLDAGLRLLCDELLPSLGSASLSKEDG
jgi:alkanesulfonate monooxygenase SsuD/methylene tetrahydromethanopterin reductase-like flavin-dependent oxidoreductase (luciferase family)